MPIYEYRAFAMENACSYCRHGFEVYQNINDNQLLVCTCCGQKVKKLISQCHSAVMEKSLNTSSVEKKIKTYEKNGMWSHAAELADKHSEKSMNQNMKIRALENYKKAGHEPD